MTINEINIGDLISTYHSGYHIVTEIIFPDRVKYVRIINEDGTPSKRITQTCHISFCKQFTYEKVTEKYNAMIASAEHLKTTLLTYCKDDGCHE